MVYYIQPMSIFEPNTARLRRSVGVFYAFDLREIGAAQGLDAWNAYSWGIDSVWIWTE